MRNPNAKVSDPNKFVTDPGNDEHILYSVKVMEDGTINLTPCGKESMNELINSQKEQTDIHYIIQQLQLGDTSVLNPRPAMYDDFSKVPTDLRDAMQIMIDGEKEFYKLPLDTRDKFDNDYRRWLVSVGSPEWIEKMFPEQVVVNDPVVVDEKGENE